MSATQKDIPWRRHYLARSQAQVTWKWREWKGDKQGFPPADLPAPGRDPDAALGQKYRRVQPLLRLADAAEVVETLSLQETNKAISSHRKIGDERDVTCLRKKVYPTAKDEHAGSSESAGHVLEENTELGAGAGNTISKSTAAGASETAEEYMEPDWSALGRPDEAPWPFTILFVASTTAKSRSPT